MRIQLVLAATSALASAPFAQTRIATEGPPVRLRYDLDSHRVEVVEGSLDASTLCFDNTIDPDGGFDALLYPEGFELLDWGVKACGGSTFVDRVQIGFSSFAVPVSQGGPGGALTLRIYEGATGNGAPGTLKKTISLTGLSSFVSTTVAPVALDIDLGAQSFFLADGPIGWSYEGLDGMTAPLLVDFDASTGTENAYDVYSPPPASGATYQGTITLPAGGISNDPNENSFWFQIYQNDVPSSVTTIQAGSNPDIFHGSAPIVGKTWFGAVDLAGVASNGVSLVALSAQRVSGVMTPYGELVVDPSALLTEVSAGVRDAHRFTFPPDSSLLGMRLFAQGGYQNTAGELRLTNGLDLSVGSF